MTYTITVITTKPATTPWYKQSSQYNPSTQAAIYTWNRLSAGWVSYVHNIPSDDVAEELYVFDTELNAINWLDAKLSRPDWVILTAYYADNGCTITTTSAQT